MQEVVVKLDDAVVEKLEKLRGRFGFLTLEEAIRFVVGSYLQFDEMFNKIMFAIDDILKIMPYIMEKKTRMWKNDDDDELAKYC
jgi:hypothetical protein